MAFVVTMSRPHFVSLWSDAEVYSNSLQTNFESVGKSSLVAA